MIANYYMRKKAIEEACNNGVDYRSYAHFLTYFRNELARLYLEWVLGVTDERMFNLHVCLRHQSNLDHVMLYGDTNLWLPTLFVSLDHGYDIDIRLEGYIPFIARDHCYSGYIVVPVNDLRSGTPWTAQVLNGKYKGKRKPATNR